MDTNPHSPTSPAFKAYPIGYASNGGRQRYLIEGNSTTGFIAWKLDDGTIIVSDAMEVSLPPSPSIAFWSCAGFEDATPTGEIIALDFHGNALTSLEVKALETLKSLHCCFNELASLNLTGLRNLEVLEVEQNLLTSLDVHDLESLRILNCAGNRLTKLDLSGLGALKILDYTNNPLVSLERSGCSSLRDANF